MATDILHDKPLEAIELFVGAGGLCLGFSEHNIEHKALVEWNKNACDTIRFNKNKGVEPVVKWADVTEGDVRDIDFTSYRGIDLVSGGPPCQPFSMGGKHNGFLDKRDMFPQAIRAVREAQPRAFFFENVRGLARPMFYNYFSYILLQFEFPSLTAMPSEGWLPHRERLEKHKTKGGKSEYYIVARSVNAADYGVPQKRARRK